MNQDKEKDKTATFAIFIAFVFGITSFALVTIFLHLMRALETM